MDHFSDSKEASFLKTVVTSSLKSPSFTKNKSKFYALSSPFKITTKNYNITSRELTT